MNGWARFQQLAQGEGKGDGEGSGDFAREARKLAAALLEMQAQCVAVHTQDACRMQRLLAAAAIAGCDVLLPSNTAAQTLAQCDARCDAWWSDAALPVAQPRLTAAADGASAEGRAVQPVKVGLMTSGSTGAAKHLTFGLDSLCIEAGACAALLDADDAEVRSSAGLQHRYGLIFHAILPLLRGLVVRGGIADVPEIMLAAGTQRVWWVSSPTFLRHVIAQREISAWRGQVAGILSAGGVLPADLRAALEQALDVCVRDVYGSTETGAVACDQDGSGFRWLAEVQAEQIEQDGGVTCVRAPWLDGAVALGDRIEMTDAANFLVRGRRDSVIKLADKRIDLARLAQILQADTAVEDVEFAVHPEHRRLFAWVALTEQGIALLRQQGRQAVVARLQAALAASQPRIAVPRFWRFESRLPRNAQSKLDKAQVEAAMLYPPLAPAWTCLEQDEDAAHYQGRVPPDLLYLRGHFAHCGIVPGVIEVKWVCALAAAWLGRKVSTRQIENLKFQKLLRPHDVVSVQLSWNAKRDKLVFRCTNDSGTCASGRLVVDD